MMENWDWQNYGLAGAILVGTIALMKTLGGLLIRAVNPKETNDIADIKKMVSEHRDESRAEALHSREVQAKLFDKIDDTNKTVGKVAERVSKLEGRLNGQP